MATIGPGRLALWWVLGVGALASLGVVALGQPRLGGNLLALTLGLAGVLRIVAPPGASGGLVVRSRGLDVAMYLALALVVAVGTNAVNWDPPR